MPDSTDVTIIGGGVAGLTATAFAGRLGLRATCVSDLLVGGQILNVDEILNMPGFPEPVSGVDLATRVEQQARDSGAAFIFGEALDIARDEEDLYTVMTTEQDLESPTVIVATGSSLRRMGIPGESRLEGSGVSYCGSCDGPLFAGKRVVVLGGGDSAADEALAIAQYAAEVVVIPREQKMTAAAATLERIDSHERITVHPLCEPLEIIGETAVSGVRLREKSSGEELVVEAEGVFVYVGLAPNTGLLDGLAATDAGGRVETDGWMSTASPGLFAAGDIRIDSPRQLVNVVSDGATAAIAAHRYLRARRPAGVGIAPSTT
jgi:thioredoxin reductase (NADPH)